MGRLKRKTQPPSVSLGSPGADLIRMVSSLLYNAHNFLLKTFHFFPNLNLICVSELDQILDCATAYQNVLLERNGSF